MTSEDRQRYHRAMPSQTITVASYLKALPDDRRAAMTKLRKVVKANLPKGFKEVINYGMPGYVVPHSLYPQGYHCDAAQPLPFAAIASTKGHIGVHHMGMYADPKLTAWFQKEYAKLGVGKLDMGKSCLRFKKIETIPYDLIGELCRKMTVEGWIKLYEKAVRN